MPLASIPSPSEGVWYLGIIPIRAYALCIVLGVVVAVWLSERRWRARGGQKGTIVDIAVPAVIFGLIGGRLYHVITDWQTYFGSRAIKEPYQALFIWEGGLGIWGAVALGGLGVWLAVRRRGISFSAMADTVAPGIAFAQGIGRWGNWFNQELYGSPTTLPWGLEIDAAHGGEPGVLYHPTFLYESIWDVALGFALIFAGRRFALHHGRLFALYVAGYTLGRFWIEGLRIDPVGGVDHAVTFLGLRINQWTSIVLFVGALVYFWATRNKQGVEVVVPPSATEADPAHPADQADADSPDTTTGDSDPATGDSNPATGDSDPATGDSDPATGDSNPATGDGDPGAAEAAERSDDAADATGEDGSKATADAAVETGADESGTRGDDTPGAGEAEVSGTEDGRSDDDAPGSSDASEVSDADTSDPSDTNTAAADRAEAEPAEAEPADRPEAVSKEKNSR
ncbi:prolipoprotein diacylglyceryl transferase [Nonomuraea sp. 10N515B]|uniref:prolipoprotein diacylglyceryl transferase n=1 Tax=Nonomuraea sp. 10N515B TaxID=3457422 RepID=UPI003FCCE9AB